uniref:Uncharacterized protein n=1 Tax=Opuntia streptacantha TaxID=393608 RepID=A0A7C9CJZ6_OPUST
MPRFPVIYPHKIYPKDSRSINPCSFFVFFLPISKSGDVAQYPSFHSMIFPHSKNPNFSSSSFLPPLHNDLEIFISNSPPLSFLAFKASPSQSVHPSTAYRIHMAQAAWADSSPYHNPLNPNLSKNAKPTATGVPTT